jgi:hypothetical protein
MVQAVFFTLAPGLGSGGFEVLATGTNDPGPAHMMYRDTSGGDWIFNSGSGAFTGRLDRDDVVRTILLNLLRETPEKPSR